MSPRRKMHRRVGSPPILKGFKPIGLPFTNTKTISVLYEEYEAFRLVDYSGLIHEEAAKIMNVSRPTLTRIYDSCLKKLAKAFTEGCSIIIEGGNVEFDKQWYRCNDCTTVFHHPDNNNEECISCDSENIEHINESISNWQQKQFNESKEHETTEYCTCPNCDYEEPHQKGIPCFSKSCPDCKTPLVRKE